MRIEDAEKAAKLARAIFADLTLYNGDKIAGSPNPRVALASEIAEARSLFRSRVLPAHYEMLETLLAQWGPAPADEPTPVRTEEKPAPPREEDPNESHFPRTMLALAVALIVAGLVGAFFYQQHQHEKLEQNSNDRHDERTRR